MFFVRGGGAISILFLGKYFSSDFNCRGEMPFQPDLGRQKKNSECTFALVSSIFTPQPSYIFKSASEQLAEHEIGADNGQDTQQFLHKVQDGIAAWRT